MSQGNQAGAINGINTTDFPFDWRLFGHINLLSDSNAIEQMQKKSQPTMLMATQNAARMLRSGRGVARHCCTDDAADIHVRSTAALCALAVDGHPSPAATRGRQRSWSVARHSRSDLLDSLDKHPSTCRKPRRHSPCSSNSSSSSSSQRRRPPCRATAGLPPAAQQRLLQNLAGQASPTPGSGSVRSSIPGPMDSPAPGAAPGPAELARRVSNSIQRDSKSAVPTDNQDASHKRYASSDLDPLFKRRYAKPQASRRDLPTAPGTGCELPPATPQQSAHPGPFVPLEEWRERLKPNLPFTHIQPLPTGEIDEMTDPTFGGRLPLCRRAISATCRKDGTRPRVHGK